MSLVTKPTVGNTGFEGRSSVSPKRSTLILTEEIDHHNVRGRALRVISNFKNLDQVTNPDEALNHKYVGDCDSAAQFIYECLRSDVVILNVDQRKLMLACLLRWLWPFCRFRLISVDLILRPPKRQRDRLKIWFERVLFSRVHGFVLFFNNLQGYERLYGIGPDRAIYVPFKVNGWEEISARPQTSSDGSYVLCAGRTLRDTQTFVEAMRIAGCPGILLQQQQKLLEEHGTSAWAGELPSNLKLVVDDSDRIEDYLDFVAKARLVVIPRFKGDIAATGISTYLVAMALNKCVIISEGPGAEDVLTDQAVIVPAEDPEKLAEQIILHWNDHSRRSEIAARGRNYAESLGGEQRLLSDILRVSIDSLR